jgi:hypothetical protein
MAGLHENNSKANTLLMTIVGPDCNLLAENVYGTQGFTSLSAVSASCPGAALNGGAGFVAAVVTRASSVIQSTEFPASRDGHQTLVVRP